MNHWFPRISPNGEHVISGDTQVFLDEHLFVNSAIAGDWLDNDRFLYRDHQTGDLFSTNRLTGTVIPICPQTSWVEGNNGRFVYQHFRNNVPEIRTGSGEIFKGFGGAMRSCAIAPDGGILMGRNSDGAMFYRRTAWTEPERVADEGISPWVTDTHGYFELKHQIYQVDLATKEVKNISLETFEYWPIVRGEWIMYHTHNRLIVRKLGTHFGHVITQGETYYPHFVLTDGILCFAWSDGTGKLFKALRYASESLTDIRIPAEVSHPVGTPIEKVEEFFLVRFTRTGSHEMAGFPDYESGIQTFMKFNHPDALEQYQYTDGQVHLIYDNTDGKGKPWRLEPNIWVHQNAKVGDIRDYPETILVRANPDGTFNDTHRLPYKMHIRSLTDNVELPMGYFQVLTVEFILREDHIERFHYARNFGWFKWELIGNGAYKGSATFALPDTSPVRPNEPIPIPPSPVEPEEPEQPMPIYNDADYEDLGKFLDEKYQIDLNRDQLPTFVDLVGRGRWTHDYIRERDKGVSHESALKLINERINAIVGLPEDQSPRPFPEPQTGFREGLNFKDGWRDGEQYCLPVFCHFGEAFSLWCREPETVKQALRDIAEAGYDGIRTWITLNVGDNPISYWEGRGVSPRYTPDYYKQLEAFINYCHSTHNLSVHLACGDLSGFADWEENALFDNLADIIAQVPKRAIALVEALNEARDTGDSDDQKPKELERLINRIRGRYPDYLYALTAYTGTEERDVLEAFTPDWMPFFLVHGYRGGETHDKIRHIFSLTYEDPVRSWGWQGEPTGPGPYVSATENQEDLTPDALAFMALMSLAMGQVWCYMSSPGVIYDRSFKEMAGFSIIPQTVKTVLPADITSWLDRFHGGTSFADKRIFAVPSTDETRADHIMSPDGRFAVFLYGPRWRECRQVKPCEIHHVYTFGSVGQVVIGKV